MDMKKLFKRFKEDVETESNNHFEDYFIADQETKKRFIEYVNDKCSVNYVKEIKDSINQHYETKHDEQIFNFLNTENQNKNIEITITENTSSSVHSLIYGKTQIGKTGLIQKTISYSFINKFLTIVSCDNKLDQLEQMKNRMSNFFANFTDQTTIISIGQEKNNSIKKKIFSSISNGNFRIVLLLLDNGSQIKRLQKLFCNLSLGSYFKNVLLIHDEGDVITKNFNLDIIENCQAKSHQEWLKLIKFFETNKLFVKRQFVTATPLNIMLLHGVSTENIIHIEDSIEYRGVDKFKIIENEYVESVRREVNRIVEGDLNGSILLSLNRTNKGQEEILKNLVSQRINCPIAIYNKDGITVSLLTIKNLEYFRKLLNDKNVDYKTKDNNLIVLDTSISIFYKVLQDCGENCTVTIGCDLLNRGISFVAEKDPYEIIKPLTACVMFYKPSANVHCTKIIQDIGRITGCSRPDLERTLYTTESIIKDYKTMIVNYENIIEKCKLQDFVKVKEISNNIIHEYIKRDLDRPKLNLSLKMKDCEKDEKVRHVSLDVFQKIENLLDKTNTNMNAKAFKYIYENKEITKNQLEKFFESIGSKTAYTYANEFIYERYKELFDYDGTNIKIKENILDYIERNNL